MNKIFVFFFTVVLGNSVFASTSLDKHLIFHLINNTNYERSVSCYSGLFKHPLFKDQKVGPKGNITKDVSHFIAGVTNISCSYEPGNNGFYFNPVTREYVFTPGKSWAADAILLSTDKGILTFTLKYIKENKEPHVVATLDSK